MLNEINIFLKNKDYIALASKAAQLAAADQGAGILPEKAARASLEDWRYLDLLQYLSGNIIEETPEIGLLRRYLIIQKGYEKVGHFFKARIAEFNHIVPKQRLTLFSKNQYLNAAQGEQANPDSAAQSVQQLKNNAAYRFFHGMMCPAYREMLLFDKIRKLAPNGKVLDYMSAASDVGLLAASRKYNVTLANADGVLLKAIQKRYRLRKLNPQLLKITPSQPMPEFTFGEYDIIIAEDILANTDDPFLLLEEFRLALKKGGHLILGKYPLDHAYNNITIDSAGRRKAIQDYLNKHFTQTEDPSVFSKN